MSAPLQLLKFPRRPTRRATPHLDASFPTLVQKLEQQAAVFPGLVCQLEQLLDDVGIYDKHRGAQ